MKILERVRNMFWTAFLQNKMILYMLLVVNIFGTIYGYYWYGWQLKETDFPLVLFVPDVTVQHNWQKVGKVGSCGI